MRKLCYITAVLAVLVMIFYYATPFPQYWSFFHIEQHAKKVVTGAELLSWGTNLLAQYPEEAHASPRVSDLGTNFPRQLLGIDYHPPLISITKISNSVGSVTLTWGSGFIGHCGFEIGPTNFAGLGRHNKRLWQPGVYFWME